MVQKKPNASLVFCLDLSFVKSGTVESSTIAVSLSISPFRSLLIQQSLLSCGSHLHEYLFLHLHFEPVCVLKTEVSLL